MQALCVRWHDIHETVARLKMLYENQQLSQNDYKAVVIILDLISGPICMEDELDDYELSRRGFLESVNKLADLKIIDICTDEKQLAEKQKASV
ncbi:hypothetical protein ACSKF1_05780 [Lactiplantibacillus plantarum]|uniref:hypothetical protein n=1 Tax=Lactiplantibacillus plantarum TaxID=1590 RepID=UPI003F65B732